MSSAEDLVEDEQPHCASLTVLARARTPSPTLSPTDPVPRGLLTLCPAASSGPQGQ